jgi:hypothetical protein
MGRHADARAAATQALITRFGVPPTAGEVKALAGVGSLESSYGAGWPGTFNIGAITADASWHGETFQHEDSVPQDDGTSKKVIRTFKKYPNAVAGWADLANEVFANRGRIIVRESARANDWRGVSEGLYSTGYYQGFGKTREERIAGHVKALTNAIKAADKEIGNVDTTTTPSLQIRVDNPQGERIGIATLTENDAPGLTVLAGMYGAPWMVAYPNGWRFLKFTPEIGIVARPNMPYTPIEQTAGLSLGSALGLGLGVAGILVTVGVAAWERHRKHAT